MEEQECEVGIQEYINPGEPMGGLIKHKYHIYRYTDFVVTEIDVNGNIIKFEPVAIQEQEEEEEEKNSSEAVLSPHVDFPQQAFEDFSRLLGQDIALQVQAFWEEIFSTNPQAVLEFPAPTDKSIRGQLYALFRQYMPQCEGKTTAKDDVQVIKFVNQAAFSGRKRKKMGFGRFASQPAKFVKFAVKKWNTDTMAAIKRIARSLGAKDKTFGLAGNKDKKAITVQYVTTFASHLRKLQTLKFDNILLGNFDYCKDQLGLGDLQGNYFEIIIRDISKQVPLQDIDQRMNSLQTLGFVNYFGLQRFGNNREAPTHKVGLALMQKDYQQAVDLIFTPRGKPEEYQARANYFNHRDPAIAYQEFPKYLMLERTILKGMMQGGGANAFLNGIMNLTKGSRMLYMHAYQSYIWNNAATLRLRQGLQALPGDLVLDEQGLPRALTEADLPNFSLSDVVMTLPGTKVVYPSTSDYEQLLAEDGLSLQSFATLDRSMALTGVYRKLTVIPGEFQWRELWFADIDAEPGEGDVRGLEVKFALPSSSYATMFLREVLKNPQTVG